MKSVSSNIDCPHLKRKRKSHGIRDSIGFKTNSNTREIQMGRIKNSTPWYACIVILPMKNGTEFQDITGIEKSVFGKKNRTTIYFAHPYCASERGSNERHNGIIRRFIPKGSEIGKYSKPKVRTIQDQMNNYPRKILKGKTLAMLLKRELSNQTSILRFFNLLSPIPLL